MNEKNVCLKEKKITNQNYLFIELFKKKITKKGIDIYIFMKSWIYMITI